MASTTSFQKKGGSKFPTIPGTRPSSYNLQLLTSSGIPSLDALFEGGWPLGSVILIQNDPDSGANLTNYTRLLLKYFLAEGVVQRHALFYGGSEGPGPSHPFSLLPQKVNANPPKSAQGQNSADDQLQIAWRYQNQGPKSSQIEPVEVKHHFNLNKLMDPTDLEQVPRHSWDGDYMNIGDNYFHNLLDQIRTILQTETFSTHPSSHPKNLLRIGISDLDSPWWASDDEDRSGLTAFLMALRSLMRQYLGVCVLTAQINLDMDDRAWQNVYECVDGVIKLSPFSEVTRQDPMFKDHHGFLEILKIPGFNVLRPSQANLGKFLFRSQRTRFNVDRIHLPPALDQDPPKPKPLGHGDIDF
ncbi:hypothetical protein TCAL_09794 [Tigriopus californicus]|uniref:Elongator complex protein 4 n=1 Tax=Tigriopus californicus TaxID=6832 RepID=A0A553PQV3_TIGCA|nr:elongator complex protein 4-like [Tigriopus californicus]TRY80051.1 hypothetical protein TCAL_09794 [Tigriopus californicus]